MVTDGDGDGDAGGAPADPESPEPREGTERMERRKDGDRTVHVDRAAAERGSKGAFLAAYLTPDRERRYGWFCTACSTFDNAMDSMGRIECNHCGNFRKPTEWDAAHE